MGGNVVAQKHNLLGVRPQYITAGLCLWQSAESVDLYSRTRLENGRSTASRIRSSEDAGAQHSYRRFVASFPYTSSIQVFVASYKR